LGDASEERLERALERRLHEVAGTAAVTERELRELTEKGEAWARTLTGLAAASERRLAALGRDPESSLSALAAELERVERVRGERQRIVELLAQVDERARVLRTAWLAGQMRSAGSA